MAGFGTNEWLVEEMYQQFLSDPSSVDQAWHEFFADYRPGSPVGASDRASAPAETAAADNGARPAPQPKAEAAPKPAAAQPKPAAGAEPAPAKPAGRPRSLPPTSPPPRSPPPRSRPESRARCAAPRRASSRT